MADIVYSITDLIGKTPLMEALNIEMKKKTLGRIFIKLERFNPTGSAKDRAALYMIEGAVRDGRLARGGTIIEPTSGNTGIGIAAVAAARGYKAVIVMPDSMSIERRKLMTAYGAELVLTPGALGMAGAIERANELASEIPGSIIAGQFENPDNPLAHYETTGPEIYDAMDGQITAFVCGIGTGGTITGCGRYFKEKNPRIKIFGVEPAGSPFITKGEKGTHDLQGIGAGFIPEALDLSVVDEVMTVTDEEAYEAGRLLAGCEGLLCGITSGAALAAAIRLAKNFTYEEENIVVLLPDTGERYLSTKMFSE